MGRTRQDQPSWRSSSLEKPPSFKPYALTPEELEIARERYHRPAEEALAWYNSQLTAKPETSDSTLQPKLQHLYGQVHQRGDVIHVTKCQPGQRKKRFPCLPAHCGCRICESHGAEELVWTAFGSQSAAIL